MEENTPEPTIKQNKKCHHLPFIIILAVLFVGAGAFGGIMFAQNLQKNNEINELKAKKDEPVAKEGEWKRVVDKTDESTGNTEDDPNKTEPTELKIGSVTINVSAKLKKKEFDNNSYIDVELSGNDLYADDDTIRLYNHDGNFSGVVFEKDIVKSFKIDGEVVQAMNGRFGNGGEDNLVFLTSDGSVYMIGIEDYSQKDLNFVMKKIDGVSNIVKLRNGSNNYVDLDSGKVAGGGAEVFAIDANGKATALYELFRN